MQKVYIWTFSLLKAQAMADTNGTRVLTTWSSLANLDAPFGHLMPNLSEVSAYNKDVIGYWIFVSTNQLAANISKMAPTCLADEDVTENGDGYGDDPVDGDENYVDNQDGKTHGVVAPYIDLYKQ